MPDSKEQAQAVEQEAQNAKGKSTLPIPPCYNSINRPSQTPTTLPIPSTPRYITTTIHPPIHFHRRYPDTMQHGEWLKNAGKKFGNAAIFGAGATAGRDAIQGAINQA